MPEHSENYGVKDTLLPTLSLFTSVGTLVCCALPVLLVTLGAGAALAGLVSAVPWLIALSKYKAWTFGISGAMIVLAGFMRWKSRKSMYKIASHQPVDLLAICRLVVCWFFLCLPCSAYFLLIYIRVPG